MARTVTVADLMQKVRRRTDEVNSRFIDDDELIDYIDSAYVTLYDVLVQKFKDYKIDVATFSTSSGVNIYQLPVNFYKFRGLDTPNGLTVAPFNFEERSSFTNQAYYNNGHDTNLRYCILGETLLLLPTPQGSETLTMWYVPSPARLTTEDQIIDGIAGYEEIVINLACIFVSIKDERDSGPFEKLLKFHLNRVEEAATQRDAAAPGTVIDARGIYRSAYGISNNSTPYGE
jgi:hypothetical protein